MAGYNELTALPPEAYLDPERFRTEWDDPDGAYAAQQYAEGLKISRQAETVCIACNGTWTARMRAGGVTTSYEGIGYHSCTADLLRGFLDGPAPLVVYRWSNPDGTTIKTASGEASSR